ncbi:dihydrofolate reductase [Nocardia arthritidis]|uniref:dihydrofolate reductase n=1 Tax=Nocardia arthritidis TaxID=228602 RepID=A0A6G9Y8P0_9NOCA|nr:dihydrofolate reductase [Nocardia arthritidis]QIS09635.1 dihydrofolate reductase [Nocardia arthritidis]
MTEPSKRIIGLIWSQTRDRVIAAGGRIPWQVPEIITHFDEVTSGQIVVMGRKTWDSLPADDRPLPGRRTIVITRDPDWFQQGAERAGSVEEALALTDPAEVWIMGGGEILREAMPFASVLAVTEVGAQVDGTVRAPEIPAGEFLMSFTTAPKLSTNGKDTYMFRSYAHK